MFEPQTEWIPIPSEEQPKLTEKEQAILKKFDSDGCYYVHTHLNTTETHSELGVLHSLLRKGIVQDYEWHDSKCVAGLVKAFYL